jgi:uncharacterized protein YdhG (YjbR/CyaY superfamily)
MNVWDSYLNKLDDTKRQIVIFVLELAKRYSVDSVESMPYGVPGLKFSGKPLIAVAAHKEHFGVYPFSPKAIKSTKELIGDHETAEGTIRFKYGDLPSEELIKKLIELRKKEISEI